MAHPARVRGLTEQEGQKLQQVVRRGSTSSVRFRRAMMLLASAGGSAVPVIARLVQADEDTVRDVIHKFNEIGLACLDPRWAGGRPRLLDRDEEDFVVQTATTRPTNLGKPFTRWSIRKLADHLRRNISRPVRIGREALRCLLARRGISFQRTKTWKESPDPDFDAKLARIEYAINERPNRTFAFDEFGPLGIRPTAGSCWAGRGCPDRLPATFRRTLANSHHPNHAVQTRALHAYLRWRNKNARHPDVLASQLRERARIRSEKAIRWGGRPLPTAA
ncbi:helix-turn-helix domain-containing protein [Streptomyces sp. JV176]|uniref:helix-turn-helix domain-containing protein n=1 Tax=Streptomyces sp. JV176 TaxID=858630 RepID=UPI002E767C70|nr:helix-turn-helix domain-containing protein [Streptomyces sp. JV176]MEE1797587.1 helix-turn-helix domain-containing protein [Streptomyces sp. JV176]